MSSDEIRKHVTAVPFLPFTINVADGRRIPVVGRDFIMFSPSGRYVDVYQRDDTRDIIVAMLITGITLDLATASSASAELNH